MAHTAEQILENYNKLNQIISDNFEGTQQDNIINMVHHFEDRISETPASARPQYHNCWPGGWLDHTLRVIETSLNVKQMFISMGVDVRHSDSDIILAALCHDLGKLGDTDRAYYIIQEDDWRRRKLNEHYTHNEDLEPLSVTDRALWLLQHFNVQVDECVWKAIKLSDGLFDDGNVSLFKRPQTSTNILHYIVHFADWMSTVAEKMHYMQTKDENLTKIKETFKPNIKKSKPITPDPNAERMKKQFEELFK